MDFGQTLSIKFFLFYYIIAYSEGRLRKLRIPKAIIDIRADCPCVPLPPFPQPSTPPRSTPTPSQPATEPESTPRFITQIPSQYPTKFQSTSAPSTSQPAPPCSYEPSSPGSNPPPSPRPRQPSPPCSHEHPPSYPSQPLPPDPHHDPPPHSPQLPPPCSHQLSPPHSHQPPPPYSSRPLPPDTHQPPPPHSPPLLPPFSDEHSPPHVPQLPPTHAHQPSPPCSHEHSPSHPSQPLAPDTHQSPPPHSPQLPPPGSRQLSPPHSHESPPPHLSQPLPPGTHRFPPPHSPQLPPSLSHEPSPPQLPHLPLTHARQPLPPCSHEHPLPNSSQSSPNTHQLSPPHSRQLPPPGSHQLSPVHSHQSPPPHPSQPPPPDTHRFPPPHSPQLPPSLSHELSPPHLPHLPPAYVRQPSPPCSHEHLLPNSSQPSPPNTHQPSPPHSPQPPPPFSRELSPQQLHQLPPPHSLQPPSPGSHQAPRPHLPQLSPSCSLNSDYRKPVVTLTQWRIEETNSSFFLEWWYPQSTPNIQILIEYDIDRNNFVFRCDDEQPMKVQINDRTISPLSGQCKLRHPSTSQLENYAVKFSVENQVLYTIHPIERKNQWMHDGKEVLGDLFLFELVIPGTHESAAYAALDGYPSLSESKNIDNGVFHQHRSIETQLQDGIRYLDLRPARFSKGKSREYVLMNGPHKLVALSVVVEQIKKFIENSQEIVIVSFRDFSQGFLHQSDHKVFINYLKKVFEKHVYAYQPITPKLNYIWQSSRRLILLYHDPLYKFGHFLWPGISQIEKNFRIYEDKSLNKRQTRRQTLRAVVPRLLSEGQDLYSAVHDLSTATFDWVTGVGRSDVNIIAVDYYEAIGVVDLAIQLNKERAQEKACTKSNIYKRNINFPGRGKK